MKAKGSLKTTHKALKNNETKQNNKKLILADNTTNNRMPCHVVEGTNSCSRNVARKYDQKLKTSLKKTIRKETNHLHNSLACQFLTKSSLRN